MKDYRQILKECLSKRVSLNPKYSLRAFARDLEISSGQLSLILQSKKGVSAAKAGRMFDCIGLSSNEKIFVFYKFLVSTPEVQKNGQWLQRN